ncbi:MAG: ankyrin repeat domain-containing protein [Candidatus Aquirickettsiella gammari]
MPTISSAATPFDSSLQVILNTTANQWSSYFVPQKIKPIFSKISTAISMPGFINDEQLNKFLDFLTGYVKSELTRKKLLIVDVEILPKLDQLWQQIQKKMIDRVQLDRAAKDIFSNYLQFLHLLMGNEHRNLFTQSAIKFDATDLHAISKALQVNVTDLDESLIAKYTALLSLSFDVPKFLKQYQLIASAIFDLAKAIFLNTAINSHMIMTQFFKLLGYQGQLLDYYRNDSRFDIDDRLLTNATQDLKYKAIDLQTYFLNHLAQREDINKPLLQHYLYSYFFKVLYKKYPHRISDLVKNKSLAPYIKTDYVALPHYFDCTNYLPLNYKVRIEYDDLSQDVAKMACQAIVCSQESYRTWKSSSSAKSLTHQSDYVFRVGGSYDKYQNFPYAYGHTPRGGGFYIAGVLENSSVTGTGYSYWGESRHNFIDVARHEAVHHDNYRFYKESVSVNAKISYFLNRNFNEGLAVLFAGGACAPGYINQDLHNITAPRLETLLQSEYIGYGISWLYNNYLMQQYPGFYADILSLSQDNFKNKWTAILNNDQRFTHWITYLNQTCQQAPKELSLDDCPSIYLKDYLPSVITTERLPRTSRFVPTVLTEKSKTAEELGRELIFEIYSNKINDFQRLLNAGANPNYRDPHDGNTPLHYLFYYGRCNAQLVQLLLAAGAKISNNNEGKSPYRLAIETCTVEELQTIKEVFDTFAPVPNTTTFDSGETGIVTYRPKSSRVTLVFPLYALSSLLSGSVSAFSDEAGRRYKASYPYLPAFMRYGIKPIALSMASASLDSLLLGTANSVGLEAVWSSFLSYFAINYLGLLIAQPIERALAKKIENKIINFLLPVLLYTSLLNPGLLFSEGFIMQWIPLIIMPLMNALLFQLGSLGTHTLMDKFFPEDLSTNHSKPTYLAYGLDGTPTELISSDENSNLFRENPVSFTFSEVHTSTEEQQSFLTFGYEKPAPPLPAKQASKLQRFSSIFSRQPISCLPPAPTQQELAEMGIKIAEPKTY